MVPAQVTGMVFAVVAHPARATQAQLLADRLAAHVVMDDNCDGALANHRRALEYAADHRTHVTILEDDALPVDGFERKLSAWIGRFPADLVSSYLGTNHPAQWMKEVDAVWGDGLDHVILPQLIHAVCVTYPPGAPQRILRALRPTQHVDYSIGTAWNHRVIYPKRSLVDHADGPTVILGRSERMPRHARALDAG